MLASIPNYQDLDLSGEAQQAAARLEARANEPASEAMFRQLVAPLLTPQVQTVLEFGCGTAALSRRIARALPQAAVHASDKSEGMLRAALRLVAMAGLGNLHVAQWDVLDEVAFPFPGVGFDLIVSSVVIPYLDVVQTTGLVNRLAARLSPGGTLAFIEQDWYSDTLVYPRFDLLRRVLNKDARDMKPTLALGLRAQMGRAGLQLLPRESFLWTDDAYGIYARDLLERMADSAAAHGRITLEEVEEWKRTLDELAASGEFYYGIVYHRVAGQRVLPTED